MSAETTKRIETWAQVGILALMIIFHAIATQERIAKVEQQIQDLKELIGQIHQGHGYQ